MMVQVGIKVRVVLVAVVMAIVVVMVKWVELLVEVHMVTSSFLFIPFWPNRPRYSSPILNVGEAGVNARDVDVQLTSDPRGVVVSDTFSGVCICYTDTAQFGGDWLCVYPSK
jgi:hypothetical protein